MAGRRYGWERPGKIPQRVAEPLHLLLHLQNGGDEDEDEEVDEERG
jgi:hypothetical protein